jgi:hypothetical protein
MIAAVREKWMKSECWTKSGRRSFEVLERDEVNGAAQAAEPVRLEQTE